MISSVKQKKEQLQILNHDSAQSRRRRYLIAEFKKVRKADISVKIRFEYGRSRLDNEEVLFWILLPWDTKGMQAPNTVSLNSQAHTQQLLLQGIQSGPTHIAVINLLLIPQAR